MPSEIDLYRSIIHDEGGLLLDQLERLDDADWSRPTACAGWDVLDVLVHLRLGTVLHSTLVRNTLAGRMVPPWGDLGVPPEANPSECFRERHREAHATGPAPNLAGFRAAHLDYAARLDEVSEPDLDRVGNYVGEMPLRFMIAARTFDLIVHAVDVRRAVGIEPLFSSDGAQFAGQFVSRSLSMFWKPQGAAGATGTIRQEVDGNAVHVTLAPDGLTFAPPDGTADASIVADGGTWTLVTWRKLPLADAEAAGMAVTGDRALVERFLAAIQTP